MYDSDFRENDVTALDTATAITQKGADSPGAFVVPAHAKAITEIIISVAADYTADTLEGFTSAIHLSGPGLSAPESWIGGPAALVGGVATTSAALLSSMPQRVLCNIPVVGGQLINCEGFMHGSADPGSIRINIQIVYDGRMKGVARYFDYREGDTASANTPVSLQNRGTGAAQDFRVGSGKISDIIVVTGGVPVAGPLGATMGFILSGNGLSIAGNYSFLSNSISTQDDITASGSSEIVPGTQHAVDIAIKSGDLRVQAMEIEDDVGTPSHIVTLGFA